MPKPSSFAVERLRLVWRNLLARLNEREVLAIRLFFIELTSLVANGVTLPTLHAMVVIIEDLLERAKIYHGLVTLKARALLAFEGTHGYGAEFDSLNRAPRIVIALENLNAVETGLNECFKKIALCERAADATAPELRVVLQMSWHRLVRDDVGNDSPPAFPEHAKDFVE
jgi:hypothetical protein